MKSFAGKILAAGLCLAFIATCAFAQLESKKALTLAAAKQIAAAAEAEATSNKFAMVITVLDDGGNLIFQERMDDAQLASIQISMGKAHTALAFKRPTKAMERRRGWRTECDIVAARSHHGRRRSAAGRGRKSHRRDRRERWNFAAGWSSGQGRRGCVRKAGSTLIFRRMVVFPYRGPAFRWPRFRPRAEPRQIC